METISKRQKKIIGVALLTITILITIAGFGIYAYGVYYNFDWAQILGVATNFLSPTTIVGIVVKFFMNQKHIKKVRNETKEIKMFFNKKEKPTSVFTEYDLGLFVFNVKRGEITIKFDNKNFSSEQDFYRKFSEANSNFTEQMRKIVHKEV